MVGTLLIGVCALVNLVIPVAVATVRDGDSRLRFAGPWWAAAIGFAGWALMLVAALVGGSSRWLMPALVLVAAGMVVIGWAQLTMGDSWRVGVDPAEHTTLVASGPYRVVRNPIYSAMVIVMAGVALVSWPPLGIAAVAVVVVGLELQTRCVEEPHLARTQPSFGVYAGRVGRFVPGIGILG